MSSPHPPATRIVATLGPASSAPQLIESLLHAGVDVLRLNFSHGHPADREQAVCAARSASQRLGVPVAILGDLCGPKIRLLEIEGGQVRLSPGDPIEIVREPLLGNARRIATNHPAILDDVQVGHRVLIDDGAVRLRAVARSPQGLTCECQVGGSIGSHKGLNLPDSDIRLPALTEKDQQDIAWSVAQDLDYVALSFVRRAEDIEELRQRLHRLGSDAHVVAKIETPRAIDNLDAIIQASDAVLVARGDLGVELDVAAVPRLQKDITHRCRRAGKPVIIATQMLQSMVDSPTPTRAEVSDVANAVFDGADALLLSAETAVGRYPVQAIEMLRRITQETERCDQTRLPPVRIGGDPPEVAAAVAAGLCAIADEIGAAAIAVWTQRGKLARLVSKHRTDCPVVALTPSPTVRRRLCLYYGIVPVQAACPDRTDQRVAEVDRVLTDGGWAAPGDRVVIGLGPHSLACGDTGSIIIHTLAQR